MKNKILVTGGSGFVGSHLVRKLLSEGHKVRVIDNISRNVNNILDLIDSKKIEFIKGDIQNKNHTDKAIDGCDFVYHLAAVCINRCKMFPTEAINVNLNGSFNVFGSCIKHNVKKVIYTSTSSVFGEPDYLPMDENLPKRAVEPYGATKYCAEQLLIFLSKKHNLDYVIIRPFNVYGPFQSTDAYYTSVINLFIKRLLSGGQPQINGSGDQSMDFTFVADLIEVLLLMLNDKIKNEDFNVAPGVDTTIKDLAFLIIKELNLDTKPVFMPREVLVTKRKCDNQKLKKYTNFEFKYDLPRGLSELISHVKENIERY